MTVCAGNLFFNLAQIFASDFVKNKENAIFTFMQSIR